MGALGQPRAVAGPGPQGLLGSYKDRQQAGGAQCSSQNRAQSFSPEPRKRAGPSHPLQGKGAMVPWKCRNSSFLDHLASTPAPHTFPRPQPGSQTRRPCLGRALGATQGASKGKGLPPRTPPCSAPSPPLLRTWSRSPWPQQPISTKLRPGLCLAPGKRSQEQSGHGGKWGWQPLAARAPAPGDVLGEGWGRPSRRRQTQCNRDQGHMPSAKTHL